MGSVAGRTPPIHRPSAVRYGTGFRSGQRENNQRLREGRGGGFGGEGRPDGPGDKSVPATATTTATTKYIPPPPRRTPRHPQPQLHRNSLPVAARRYIPNHAATPRHPVAGPVPSPRRSPHLLGPAPRPGNGHRIPYRSRSDRDRSLIHALPSLHQVREAETQVPQSPQEGIEAVRRAQLRAGGAFEDGQRGGTGRAVSGGRCHRDRDGQSGWNRIGRSGAHQGRGSWAG